MLTGVFNQSVGQFGDASFGWKTGLEFNVHALVTLRFDQIGAILHALFHERDNLGLRLVIVGLGIVAEPGLLLRRRRRAAPAPPPPPPPPPPSPLPFFFSPSPPAGRGGRFCFFDFFV